MKRQLGKGGSGPCQFCQKIFLRVLRHEPQCKARAVGEVRAVNEALTNVCLDYHRASYREPGV